MPAKGQTQSEETKKKISEALKKDGGVDNATATIKRSAAAQKLYNSYTDSMRITDDLKQQREALKQAITALGRKKTTSNKRKAIREQIKAITAKMKVEREKRSELRRQASAAKRVKKAEIYLKKAQLRTKKVNDLVARAQAKMASAKTPEAKARYQAIITRAQGTQEKINAGVEKANATISSKGIAAKKTTTAFDFSENYCHCEKLEELPYKPFRPLTMQEKRCNLEYLNEQFNTLQTGLEKDLTDLTNEEIDAFLQTAENKINAGDLAAIALLILTIRKKVKKILDVRITESYEVGKKTAADEMQVERPATSPEQTQLKNLDVNNTTDGYLNNIEQTGKSHIVNALAAGAALAAVISTARDKMKQEAVREITNIAGTTIGQYINRGRQQVFRQNIAKIAKYQRSEVLDDRTCNICISIDQRVVKADDPLAQMDIVHTHCRGVWIPIFVDDEEQPDVTGIPKSVLNSFELIDGRPTVNSFKQLKKPIKIKKTNK